MNHRSKPLYDALTGKVPDRVPVWFMRQAGRCLPEYRKIRDQMNTYDMFLTADIASEITLQPLRRFDYDAAIVYADILHVADVLGCGLSFVRGTGPVMKRAIRTTEDMDMVQERWPESKESVLQDLSFIQKTIAGVLPKLSPHHTLIGFAGSPWSVACYMIEGRSPGVLCSGVKRWMFENPKLFGKLMSTLTQITVEYLALQKQAGAEVLQIFESHSGMALSYDQYQKFCLPYLENLFAAVRKKLPTTPLIYYLGGSSSKLPLLSPLSPYITALSVDHRMSLQVARQHPISRSWALQGNLDPDALHQSPEALSSTVEGILQVGRKHQAGYIFNVGHGLKPDAPLAALEAVITQVHQSTP